MSVYKFLDLINIWQVSRLQFNAVLAHRADSWLKKGASDKFIHMKIY